MSMKTVLLGHNAAAHACHPCKHVHGDMHNAIDCDCLPCTTSKLAWMQTTVPGPGNALSNANAVQVAAGSMPIATGSVQYLAVQGLLDGAQVALDRGIACHLRLPVQPTT